MPYADAAAGVTVDTSGRAAVVRFGRTDAASKLWRRIAGRRTSITCDTSVGEMAGLQRSGRERGRRVRLLDDAGNVCTIATRRRGDGTGCYPDEDDERWCVRAVVALTDVGRAPYPADDRNGGPRS